MIIKLIEPYQVSPAGTILNNISVGVAELLIQRGIAVKVVKKKKKRKE